MPKSPISLSLCIPTYRRAPELERTLAYLAETMPEGVEVIVSDNASPDETPTVVARWQQRLPHLRYHRQPDNQGACANLTTALSMARGDLIYPLCDDDRPLWPGLQSAITRLSRQPDLLAVYGGHEEWQAETNTTIEAFPLVQEPQVFVRGQQLAFLDRIGLAWFPVARREIVQRFLLTDERGWGHWQWLGTLLHHGNVTVIPDILYQHAQTAPRLEYALAEGWYHDHYRCDLDAFFAGLPELAQLEPEAVIRIVGAHCLKLYEQGAKFSRLRGDILRERLFLQRAKAYRLFGSEALFAWEQRYLLQAAAATLYATIRSLNAQHHVILEATPMLARLRRHLPGDLQVAVIATDALVGREPQAEEFIVTQRYDTIQQRLNHQPQAEIARHRALDDLLAGLRLTDRPLTALDLL